MATPGKGGAGGSQWSQQHHQQQLPAAPSSHLLSPNSASAGSRNRRRSTLSNHGFFIEYSSRRNSSALNQQQQRPPLAHLALVSPVRVQPGNGACESPQSPLRASQGSRLSRASCSASIGQQIPYVRAQNLMPPVSAPSALVGSRKTSIFDPAGHSLASSQLLSASAAAASCDVTRRRSTITMGPAALAAQQQMLAVAMSHSAAGVHGKRRKTLVQQVPVIGCSPTSIQGSLKALEESRRYEKMLRSLREQKRQKEKRRRKRRRKLQASGLPSSSSRQQPRDQPTVNLQECNSLSRAIKDAAKGLLTSKGIPKPVKDAKKALHEQARLSVSTLSLGSWSTSSGSGSSFDATSDSELSSGASSVASLSPNTERRALGDGASEEEPKQRKSFMSQAFRKLASLSTSSPSVAVRQSSRSVPLKEASQNYWHYFYYLRENSIDQSSCLGADELLVAGEPLSPKKRRERLNANFSLTRLEILNCGATCRPNPRELLEAQELAAQGKPEMLARMFSQSTDISLALSTSSSSLSSSSNPSISSISQVPRDTDEPEESSTEGWSVSSSVRLGSTGARLSSSDESTSTAVGYSRRPISGARSVPSSRNTPPVETSFNSKHKQQQQQQQASVSRSSPHPTLNKRSLNKQQTTDQQEDEEEDDFERLSKCHRGYKLKASELLEMMQQQEPTRRSIRNSSQRLSVRSIRSIGSPGRARDGSASGAAHADLSGTHGISLSWGTLNQLETTESRSEKPPGQPAKFVRNSAIENALKTGNQLTMNGHGKARRCTSASLGPGSSHLRLADARSARLNISANDLAVDRASSGASNRQSLGPGEPRARAHSTGSKWNQPEASKSTPARLSSCSLLLAAPENRHATSPTRRGLSFNQQAAEVRQQQPPDVDGTGGQAAAPQNDEELVDLQYERLQLFELVRKGSFTCMVLGARQTGKRSIVKCFVKLLNEFKLAMTEYRKEKMLTQLLGCSQQLQGILQQRQQQQQDDKSPGSAQMRSRVNSWFAGGPVNRLLTTGSARQARNSTCLADRGLGRQSFTGYEASSGLGDAGNRPSNINNASPDNRFLCVSSVHGINKSDTSINYQSNTQENVNYSLSFQVPTTTLQTRSLGPPESASIQIEKRQRRRARTKLRRLLSLRELNKKRVRIRFSSRRKLGKLIDDIAPHPETLSVHLLDIYLVVYAINDRDSFTAAGSLLKQLTTLRRPSGQARYVPVILVANKVDLERAKVVKNEGSYPDAVFTSFFNIFSLTNLEISQEGKALAKKHRCKFMEISCAVGYNLDNLLVGIRTQLVLKHHVELNSYLSVDDTTTHKDRLRQDAEATGASGKSKNFTQSNRKQNIIMRIYKRYVTDNFAEDNYDCDNFSVL